MVPAVRLLFRVVVPERIGTIVLSALIAHSAWHWTGERWARLRQFDWPALDPVTLAAAVRGLIVVVVVGAVAWMILVVLARRSGERRVVDEQRERGV